MDVLTYRLQGGLSHVSLSLGLAQAVQRDTSTLFFDIFSIQKTSLFRLPPSHDCEHAPNLPVSHPYTGHGSVLQFRIIGGEAPLQNRLLARTPVRLLTQFTIRTRKPPPHVLLHLETAVVRYSKASHLCTLHSLIFWGPFSLQ